MKCVFKQQDLQMFGFKLNKYSERVIFTHLKLWVATHNFEWVKI